MIGLAALSTGGGDPNWLLSSVIGAIIGALVVPVTGLLAYPVRRLRVHTTLIGRWYSYHYSFRDEILELRYGTLHIRPGLRRQYVVHRKNSRTRPDPNGRFRPAIDLLRYRGSLHEEGHHIIVEVKPRDSRRDETVFYRFLGQIPSNASVVPGLWMAYDHDRNPAAGTIILSREPLTDEAATRLLRSWTKGAFAPIRIRRPSPSVP